MIWIELRTNETVYNDGWNFSQSVWAPTLKKNGDRWPFWLSVNNVAKGDIIFHLRHFNGNKQFLGYSVAATDSYLTDQTPTDEMHGWDFSRSFYKVDLVNYQSFATPVQLSDFFSQHNIVLRDHFNKNKERTGHKHLFYTIQRNKLQCLFGAYFSELDEKLVKLLTRDLDHVNRVAALQTKVATGEIIQKMKARIGQQEFSENVKRNFDHKCCFPGCNVEGRNFLIGGHIDRWCDNVDFRGDTDNGICFCLMHDKAFERGYFTLDTKYRVCINPTITRPDWLNEYLNPGLNLEIKPRQIPLSIPAIKKHWHRIKFKI